MSKQKVFIVLSHLHRLNPRSNGEWEAVETIEFVDQLRKKHYSYASVIGDYINNEMIMGERFGMGEYAAFEKYVREKYAEQMGKLDNTYGQFRVIQPKVEVDTSNDELVTDKFGNIRTKTVFDV